jgi:hypothetical protein
MMRPLSFSAQLQLNHTAPLSRTEKRASQRSGFNLTPPPLQKEIDQLIKQNGGEDFQKTLEQATKSLNLTTRTSWQRRLDRFTYWAKGLWTRLRSDIMGLIRGIRINHQHIMNRFLPGIQDWIHTTLKQHTVSKVIQVNGHSVPVHFTTFELPKAKSADGIHRIAIFGDPGYSNAMLQLNVDGSIAIAKAQGNKLDAAFLTGDCLYSPNQHNKNNASRGSGDSRSFHSNVGAVYDWFIKHKVPIFTCIGNNDSDQGHAEAFAHYMSLPRYYKVIAGDTEFFFVDENVMSSKDIIELNKRFKTTHYTEEADKIHAAQQYWLETALSESKQQHPERKRIIVKHFPIVSSDPQTNELAYLDLRRTSFDRFFANPKEYGVTGVLNGHEHGMAVNTITHTMGEDGTAQALPQPIQQLTLGSSSHCEPPETGQSYMNDPHKLAWRGQNSLGLPQTPGALWVDPGFGLLELEKGSSPKISFIKTPTDVYYHGEEIVRALGNENNRFFSLLYRAAFGHPLGQNNNSGLDQK